jgi:hypothetical protein
MPVLPYGAATEVLYDGSGVRHGGGGASAGFASTVTGPRSGLIGGSGVYGVRDLYIDVLFPFGEAVNDAYWWLDRRIRGYD